MTEGSPDPVLFLSNAYPDSPSSTRGIFIRKLASLLGAEEFSISVVTPRIYAASPCFEVDGGIRVYRFPFGAGEKRLIEHERIPYVKMGVYLLSGLILGGWILFSRRSRVIHVHWAIPTGLIGLVLKWISRRPLVVTLHGSDYKMGMEGGSWIRKLFLLVCRRADVLFCVSERMRKGLIDRGVDPSKMVVSPMGVDEAFFRAGDNRTVLSERMGATVLSTRNFFPVYNLSLLMKAVPYVLQKIPDTRFVIAGEGPERGRLEAEARALKVEGAVRFLGRVPGEEMPKLVAEADLYVSTSLSDGTSVSLLEALAAGAFPIVTDIPANREWVTDGGNGFLVPCDDPKVLAQRMVEALRNPEHVEEARNRNRILADEKGGWQGTVEETRRAYRLLSRDKRRNR